MTAELERLFKEVQFECRLFDRLSENSLMLHLRG